jgi:hypothetical protein
MNRRVFILRRPHPPRSPTRGRLTRAFKLMAPGVIGGYIETGDQPAPMPHAVSTTSRLIHMGHVNLPFSRSGSQSDVLVSLNHQDLLFRRHGSPHTANMWAVIISSRGQKQTERLKASTGDPSPQRGNRTEGERKSKSRRQGEGKLKRSTDAGEPRVRDARIYLKEVDPLRV